MAQPVPGKRKLVVIEDSTLAGMALNAVITKEFPFLQALSRQTQRDTGKRTCGRCGQASTQRATLFGAAKQQLAGMDQSKKRRLKELLNAEQARVTFRGNDGKVINLTF